MRIFQNEEVKTVTQDMTVNTKLNFQTLFESLPGLYVVYSLDLAIVGGSDAYFQAIRSKREEIVGRNLLEIFPAYFGDSSGNELQSLLASLESVLEHHQPEKMEAQKYRIPRLATDGDGFEERYWTSISFPLCDENKEITHIIQQVEDVTESLQIHRNVDPQRQIPNVHGEVNGRQGQQEQKEMQREQALQLEAEAAKQQVETILSSISEAFYVIDRHWCFTYANDRLYEIIGMEREQILGHNIWELFPDSVDTDIYHQFHQAMVEQVPIQAEYFYLPWNRWYSHRIYPSNSGLTVFGSDITEAKHTETARKHAEDSYLESEKRLQMALAGARQGIWDWDLKNEILTWDDRCKEMFGLPHDFAVTYEWHVEALHPDDRQQVYEAGRLALRDHLEFHQEYRTIHPDSTVRWILACGRGFYDAAGEPCRMAGTVMDITDRKQAEAALRESEERFRQLADSAPMLVWMSGIDKLCYYFNRPWLRFTGRTMEQELGNGWVEGVHPDDLQRCFDTYTTAFDQRISFEMDYRLRRFDGEYGWVLDAGTPRLTPEGEFLGYIGSCIDITERIQAVDALRQSEERYRTLFESIDEGFCIIEVLFDENNTPYDYRFLEVNPVFEEQTGLRQAIGKTARQLVPDLEEHWVKTYGQVALTGESVRFENRAEAMHRWFDVDACRTGRPEERKVAVVFKDITDRKRSEQALQASEEQSRNILESISEAFFALDHEWQFTYVNKQAESLLNRTPGDLLGKIIWEEYAGLFGSEFEKAYYRTANEQIESVIVSFYPDHDRWYEVHTYPAASGITIYFRDVTELKQIETVREQLLHREQRARETAETANRIKDEFLAILSHELRAPLNPILGWTQLLQIRKLDETKTAEAYAIIERSARLQAQLIDDLLDISKILRGKLGMDVATVNLVFVIQAALDTVRSAATAKSILIHTDLSAICQVSGDAARLQQVVWNLLSNAVKFTPSHGQINIRLEQVENQAQITVRDTGKGMDPSFLPYIFESFRQEDASTTRKYGGLGLGLAIVRTLVEAHGGTIFAFSKGEGQGATFTVQLPLLNAEIPGEQPEHLSKQGMQLPGVRVLVVDDDLDSRELLTTVLELHGSEVIHVASAAEALACLQTFQVDVLVSDIGMPEMDGYAFLQALRSLSPEKGGQIPAIALSAYARTEDIQKALNCGYQQHINKPVNLDQLIQTIEALI
ncbi:MAG: PAS domain S-box protein [Anaerolineae bacterium]|nr:PAS domain S-box protein [Gloeobacterales cyanobacterium ES-bin-313]